MLEPFLSAEQRFKIYRDLLILFVDRRNSPGFCCNMIYLTGIEIFDDTEFKNHLPELYSHKPNICYDMFYWFPEKLNPDYQRIYCLEMSIKEILEKHPELCK